MKWSFSFGFLDITQKIFSFSLQLLRDSICFVAQYLFCKGKSYFRQITFRMFIGIMLMHDIIISSLNLSTDYILLDKNL